MNKVYAIIPAGGSGKRTGSDVPKQYMEFQGRELIAFTIDIFQKNKNVNGIIIAAQKSYFDLLTNIKDKYGFTKIKNIVEGGKERQQSVFNALSSIKADDDDIVLVHDAARPLLPQNILDNVIASAHSKGNAVVSIKAKDTLVNGTDTVVNYINRGTINYVQTPQAFKFSMLWKAIKQAEEESFLGTDESMLVSRIGETIHLIEGSSLNFKVTTESDVELFHLISANSVKDF